MPHQKLPNRTYEIAILPPTYIPNSNGSTNSLAKYCTAKDYSVCVRGDFKEESICEEASRRDLEGLMTILYQSFPVGTKLTLNVEVPRRKTK